MIRLDSNKTGSLNSIYDEISDYIRKTFRLTDFFKQSELSVIYPGEALSAHTRKDAPAIGNTTGSLVFTEITNPDNLSWELGNTTSHSALPHRKRLNTLWRDNDAAIVLREQKAAISFSVDVQLSLPSRHALKRLEQGLIDMSKGRSFHEVDIEYKDIPPRAVLMILFLYYKQRVSINTTKTFQEYLADYMLVNFDYVVPKDQVDGRSIYFPTMTKALLKIEYNQDAVEQILREGTHASGWNLSFTITGQFTYREGYVFEIPAVVENAFTPSEITEYVDVVSLENETVKIPKFDATHVPGDNQILSLAFTIDESLITSIDLSNLGLCTLHPTILDILQDQSEDDTIKGYGLYKLTVYANGVRVDDPSLFTFTGTTLTFTTTRTDMRFHLVLEEMLEPGKMSDDTVDRLLPKYGWFLKSKAVNAYIKFHNTDVLVSNPKRKTVQFLDMLRQKRLLSTYINRLVDDGALYGRYIEYGDWTTEVLGYMFVNIYDPLTHVKLIYKLFEYAEADGYVIPMDIQTNAAYTQSAKLLGYTKEDRYGPISNGTHLHIRVLRN